MKNIIYILLFIPSMIFSQEKEKTAEVKLAEKQILRKGNDLYKEKRYVDAEVKYKKALQKNQNYETANYNLANAIYQQNRFKEALPGYGFVIKSTKDKKARANAFHNIGDISIKEKQYAKAVSAFKNSLRLNPGDDETRYNLALAQKLLKDQQNKDKKDDKDKKDNKDKNQDQKKDQGDNDKKNKDQDKGDDNKDKQDKKDKGNNEQKDKQKPKPQPNKLNQQQMQQLLEAMSNEENKTQKKVNAKKARGKKVKQEKDW